ncbi:MAG: CDP-diacylglycerol--serine O-phosphatidyltransferase [Candidatus Lernaella stagnicola]|nr:CDP-diacylglycerol--serine O-phosphatidyltransferase [Candidatus Lernaella stagnicola]
MASNNDQEQHGILPELEVADDCAEDDDGQPCDDDSGREGPRRGFYLLPNTMTAASLMLGFYSISMSFGAFIFPREDTNYFIAAAWAIFVAGIFDGLDGRIARLTRTTSPFGMQFDSLSDLISFGLAPAFLVYNFALRWGWGDHRGTGLGWVIAFIYVACGAMRLARFNVTTEKLPKGVFQGLSIPAAAGTLAFSVLMCVEMECTTLEGKALWFFPFMILTLAVSMLMVSTFYFPNFKSVAIHRRHPFGTFLFVVVLLTVTFAKPVQTLFMAAVLYALSGPFFYLFYYRRHGVYPYAKAPDAS